MKKNLKGIYWSPSSILSFRVHVHLYYWHASTSGEKKTLHLYVLSQWQWAYTRQFVWLRV
jgi:hypothetical protein